jgi:exonuclease III
VHACFCIKKNGNDDINPRLHDQIQGNKIKHFSVKNVLLNSLDKKCKENIYDNRITTRQSLSCMKHSIEAMYIPITKTSNKICLKNISLINSKTEEPISLENKYSVLQKINIDMSADNHKISLYDTNTDHSQSKPHNRGTLHINRGCPYNNRDTLTKNKSTLHYNRHSPHNNRGFSKINMGTPVTQVFPYCNRCTPHHNKDSLHNNRGTSHNPREIIEQENDTNTPHNTSLPRNRSTPLNNGGTPHNTTQHIKKSRWDIPSIIKAKLIASRFTPEPGLLTMDHTHINRIPSLRPNTRWSLSPTRKARIISNRLVNEHYTYINLNFSNTTNDTNSDIHPNKPVKKPRPHRGRKSRPKDFIKKLNKKDQLKIGFVNTQSAILKVLTIKDYILEHDIDILYIAESWFKDKGDEVTIGNMIPEGYRFKQIPRMAKNRGGGIAVIHKKHIQLKKESQPIVASMEIMETTININARRITCITIYRPESSDIHKYTMSTFFAEFENLLTHYILTKDELLIIGDFNFHMNKPDRPNVKRMTEVLGTFDLIQHVTKPTHKLGNTLDLIITKRDTKLLSHKVDEMLSDHNVLQMNINIQRPPWPVKYITHRKLKNVDIKQIKKDIKKLNKMEEISDTNKLVSLYNEELIKILDKHAPKNKIKITVRNKTPWTSEEIRPDKTLKRKLERRWLRTKLTIDEQNFKEQRNKFNALLRDIRSKRLANDINENKNDLRRVHQLIGNAMYLNDEKPLPPEQDGINQPEEFINHFHDKTTNIRNALDEEDKLRTKFVEELPIFKTELNNFKELTEEQVKEMVFKSPNKFCELDPMPTWMIRDCIKEILPLLTKIIKLSLRLGEMPVELNVAIIKQLLKKLGLDLVKQNYRPVSNLAFLGKLIERIAALQLVDHLQVNNLLDTFQSAYREYHSTETALLKVQNDILMHLDKSDTVMLVLLDLSAAFDTIDHGILVKRMEKRCGIKGNVLKFLKSYLTERKQKVVIGDSESSTKDLKYGVPQGSVLGPILFNIYLAPLGDLIRKHGLQYHIYADDTQLYIAFSPLDKNDSAKAKLNMEECISTIRDFLLENRMKLNDGKTEFLIMGTANKLKKVNFDEIKIGQVQIKAAKKAKNLGVMYDCEGKLIQQVSNICKIGFYRVRNLAKIRKSLDLKTAKIAAAAFTTSSLDYCNALLHGLPKNQINKIQLVQNSAARVVMGLKKHEHITHARKELHWLPIEARCKFKIITLTWKALNNMGPTYIKDLLKVKSCRPGLQSNKSIILEIPKTNLTGCGKKSFL